MFTVKLYRSTPTTSVEIIEADSVTVLREDPAGYLKRLTAHRASGDALYYVGAAEDIESPHPDRRYDYAYVENAAGKTTETVHPTPKPVAGAERLWAKRS